MSRKGFLAGLTFVMLIITTDVSESEERNTLMNEEHSGLPKSRIPAFASREEEAAFWDTHDATDYLDELTPVTMRAAHPLQVRNLSANVQVRFDAETDQKLEDQARARGVKKATLIRMWVLERLRDEEH